MDIDGVVLGKRGFNPFDQFEDLAPKRVKAEKKPTPVKSGRRRPINNRDSAFYQLPYKSRKITGKWEQQGTTIWNGKTYGVASLFGRKVLVSRDKNNKETYWEVRQSPATGNARLYRVAHPHRQELRSRSNHNEGLRRGFRLADARKVNLSRSELEDARKHLYAVKLRAAIAEYGDNDKARVSAMRRMRADQSRTGKIAPSFDSYLSRTGPNRYDLPGVDAYMGAI